MFVPDNATCSPSVTTLRVWSSWIGPHVLLKGPMGLWLCPKAQKGGAPRPTKGPCGLWPSERALVRSHQTVSWLPHRGQSHQRALLSRALVAPFASAFFILSCIRGVVYLSCLLYRNIMLKSVCLYLNWFLRYGAFLAKIVPNCSKLATSAQMRQLQRMFIIFIWMLFARPIMFWNHFQPIVNLN